MAPIKMAEVDEMIQALGDPVDALKPASVTIHIIAKGLEKVKENKQQCFYLFKRSATLYYELNDMAKGKAETVTAQNIQELVRALDLVKELVEQLGTDKMLRRFLQRREISSRILAAHEALNGCIDLYQVKSANYLRYSNEDLRVAEQTDETDMLAAVAEIKQNEADILKELGIQRDQALDAIRGLQNALEDAMADQLQKQFAQLSLDLLKKIETNKVVSYDWAISELEIQVDGAVIGAGGFGQVYIGSWGKAKVAVKRLQRELPKDMLIKEIEIWQKLQFPHVATFYKACIDSNPPFLVAKFYKHGNIAVYLKQTNPSANRARLCGQIALGMNFLHSKNVIHADLKAANVLIDDGEQALICDFGLSEIKTWQSARTVADAPVQAARGVAGTRVYMAPERLRRGSLTPATDMYAFAITLFEIYAEVIPFRNLPPNDFFESVVKQKTRPERPVDRATIQRGLTDSIWRMIEEGWADDPKSRPTFAQIGDRLDVEARLASARPPPPVVVARQVEPPTQYPAEEPVRLLALPFGSSALHAEEHIQANIQLAAVYSTSSALAISSDTNSPANLPLSSVISSYNNTQRPLVHATIPAQPIVEQPETVTPHSNSTIQPAPKTINVPATLAYAPQTGHSLSATAQRPQWQSQQPSQQPPQQSSQQSFQQPPQLTQQTLQYQPQRPQQPPQRPQQQSQQVQQPQQPPRQPQVSQQPQQPEEFPCGLRTLTNVMTENIAYLPDSTDSSDVLASNIEGKPGEKWRVSKAGQNRYFIQNEAFSSYAVESNGIVGKRGIKGVWLVKETRFKDTYTISPSDKTELYWGLQDHELGTPVELRKGATDKKNHWRFS